MGGYGAVKLALKYPEMFCSAVSHSGAVAVARRASWGDKPNPEDAWGIEMRRIFGDDPRGGPDDTYALAEKLDPAQRPALRIDCGVDDFLIQENRDFHAHLQAIGYPHEYEEYPGAHNWAYWDLHVQEAIAFHARHLGLEKKTEEKPKRKAPAAKRRTVAG